ncbi:MAG TPA: NAD(P)-dependent alcohol dehydrogenase [Chitinophagaceae bacterium]|nr:NAD(P)-dependent alcohol dehydrogenase [Chitinophagaceae bacterium]
MKAAIRVKYGLPKEVVSIQEIDKPTPKDDEVLIKVYAASANRTDYHVLTGKPNFMRLFTGLSKPRLTITGSDFAGRVEAIGPSVKTFKAGDKVMGFGGVFCIGSHTEYITFPETKGIVPMPDNITYEQAAACLEGTYYAAAGINHLKPVAGQKAMVYGATGAIGSADVQFFKYYGLYVTAVCGGEHADLIRSLGADKVIDYKTQDFTKDEERYDYIIDAVDKTGFLKCKPLLKNKGIYSSSGGFEYMAWSLITKITGGKKVLFIPPKDIKGNLGFIRERIEEGRFRPLIDRIYPLDKIAEAFTYVGSGQKIGNVIIKMNT